MTQNDGRTQRPTSGTPTAPASDRTSLPAGAIEGVPFAGLGAMLAAQTSLLAAMEPVAEEWMHRRQAAMTAAREALSGLREAPSPMAAFSLLQAWWAGAAERLAQDGADCMALSLALLNPAAPPDPVGKTAPEPQPPVMQVPARAA